MKGARNRNARKNNNASKNQQYFDFDQESELFESIFRQHKKSHFSYYSVEKPPTYEELERELALADLSYVVLTKMYEDMAMSRFFYKYLLIIVLCIFICCYFYWFKF